MRQKTERNKTHLFLLLFFGQSCAAQLSQRPILWVPVLRTTPSGPTFGSLGGGPLGGSSDEDIHQLSRIFRRNHS